jgi:homeobox protein cut-like
MEKEKATEELASIKKELLLKAQELDRSQKLVVELESHVEHLQELNSRGEAEGRSSADILDSLVLATTPSTSTPPLYPPSSESLEGRSGEASSSKALLPIVQAQRERFRQRNAELEEEQEQNVKQLTLLQAQVKDLTADNVKLYEKIRFLQGYQAGRFKNGDGGNDVSVNVEAKYESVIYYVAFEKYRISFLYCRYRNRYEERLDPFASFSQQERQRRYGQLNVAEKILLSFVQFMVSNKIARLFIFFYSVLLHILVFMVLMKLAYNDASRRDQAFEAKFVAHMNEVHGHT